MHLLVSHLSESDQRSQSFTYWLKADLEKIPQGKLLQYSILRSRSILLATFILNLVDPQDLGVSIGCFLGQHTLDKGLLIAAGDRVAKKINHE